MSSSLVLTGFMMISFRKIVFVTLLLSVGVVASRAQEFRRVYQVNCGGPAAGTYSADNYFEGGKVYTTNTRVDTRDVQNAPPAAAYNTQRYGNFTYTFPELKAGASYLVRLHFAETYFSDPRPGRFNSAQAGQRVFAVTINHKVVLDRFDILATATSNHAVVKEFNTTADDSGRIKIVFQSLVTEAMVNAIEILQDAASSARTSSPAKPDPTGPNTGARSPTSKVTFNAQNPCDDEDARRKKGFWDRGGDDLAMADSTFPKDQYSIVLKKADQAMSILERSIPDLSGIDVQGYRSIRGNPYVAKGPVPFGIEAPVFGYGCIPLSATNASLRGTIVLGDETGTWLHVYFNGLGRIAGDSFVGHTANGARIYRMPKSNENIKGYPVLVPLRLDGSRDEAVIITADGQPPFRPVSREKYLLGRQKAAQAEVDRLSKLTNVNPGAMTQRQNELVSITNLLNSMTDAEKQMQAVVKDFNAFPGGREKIFVTEAEGGYPLITIDAKLFEPGPSRTAVRIITVYWELNPQELIQASAVRQLKANLDVAALKHLLDQ